MKKISLIAIAFFALSISSCKKDHVCECTRTETSTTGNVTTDPVYNTTYRDVKRGEAKTLCQNSTETNVNENGGTSTVVYDCELK